MRSVKTHCKMCNCRCGIILDIEGDEPVAVRGDPDCRKNDGALCVRGRAMLELYRDEERLHAPEKSADGEFVPISWDQALEEIAGKLKDLKSSYGPEALAVYRGMSVYSWLVNTNLKKFMNIYGTPNYSSNSALCVGSKIIASRMSFGPGVSACGDFRRSKCILLFGTNPAITGMHRSLNVMKDILHAKKQGAKLIVIDPKRTETAAKADIYTTIRPGTDLVLIYAIIRTIIENGWHDQSFIDAHVQGFEALKQEVLKYTPEYAETLTWVPAESIRQIAKVFSASKPACADRREGILHHENGTQTCRAINMLNAITGNVDIPGGIHLQTNLYGPAAPIFKELTLEKEFGPKIPSISYHNKITQDIPTDLIDAILDEKPYPIKALLIFGSNPLLAWPDSDMVRKALEKLELLVCVDLYRNDTGTLADYNLPAAMFLEKIDFQAPEAAIPRIIQYQPKVLPRRFDSKSDFEIISALAGKMGFGDYFEDSEDVLLEKAFGKWGIKLDSLKRNESGVEFEPRPVGYYHTHPYPSASGKIEVESELLKINGFDELPRYIEESESVIADPETKDTFPLMLISGNRVNSAYLSATHNLPSLNRICPENWVEIHPTVAAKQGIANGDIVQVSSRRGCIQLKAKIVDLLDPRVVMIPYGWGHVTGSSWTLASSSSGANVNFLTDHTKIDRISGMPAYKMTLCQVAKVDRP